MRPKKAFDAVAPDRAVTGAAEGDPHPYTGLGCGSLHIGDVPRSGERPPAAPRASALPTRRRPSSRSPAKRRSVSAGEGRREPASRPPEHVLAPVGILAEERGNEHDV